MKPDRRTLRDSPAEGLSNEADAAKDERLTYDGHALSPDDIRNTVCGMNVGSGTWSLGYGVVTCEACRAVEAGEVAS